MDPAQLTRCDGLASGLESHVEPPGIADLDRNIGPLALAQHADRVVRIPGQRLLAETGNSGVQRGQDQIGVNIGGRRNHQPIKAGAEELGEVAGSLYSVVFGLCGNDVVVHVVHDQPRDLGRPRSVAAWNAPMRPSPTKPNLMMAPNLRSGSTGRDVDPTALGR